MHVNSSDLHIIFFSVFIMPGNVVSPKRRGKIAQATTAMSTRHVALLFNVSKSTVHRIKLNEAVEQPPTSPDEDRSLRGRPRKTSARALAHIERILRTERRLTMAQILGQCHSMGLDIGLTTLRSILADLGYNRCVAAAKPFHNEKTRSKRLSYATEQEKDTQHDWERTIFVDEASIKGGGGKQRVWVTRKAHERYDPACLIPRFTAGSVSVMFWGAVWHDGRSELVAFDLSESTGKKGGVTTDIYRDQITKGALHQCWKQVSREWRGYGTPRIVEDNVPVHTSDKNRNAAKKQKFVYLNHPPSSPDLNPIENCWAYIKREIARLPVRPNTRSKLIEAAQRAWREMPQSVINNSIGSMKKRLEAVIRNKGYATKY